MHRLLLFAKLPRLNHVKTRLSPPLDPSCCLELYRAFLQDQIAFLRSFSDRYDVQLWFDGTPTVETTRELALDGLPLREQGQGDLGRRMFRAVQSSWREGAAATIVIGADAPTLPARVVGEAFELLHAEFATVVTPADDGGYVLIGMRSPQAELFRDVPWGGPDVLATTMERAEAAGVSLQRTAPWYDVDDASDLARLRAELDTDEGSIRAPTTTRFLARLDPGGRPVI